MHFFHFFFKLGYQWTHSLTNKENICIMRRCSVTDVTNLIQNLIPITLPRTQAYFINSWVYTMNFLSSILIKYICCATCMTFQRLRLKWKLTDPHKIPEMEISAGFIPQRRHRVLRSVWQMVPIPTVTGKSNYGLITNVICHFSSLAGGAHTYLSMRHVEGPWSSLWKGGQKATGQEAKHHFDQP